MLKILNKLLSSKKDNQKNTKNKIFLKDTELSFKEVSYYLEKNDGFKKTFILNLKKPSFISYVLIPFTI